MRLRVLFIVVLFISCQSQTEDLPILSYTINSKGEKETYSITYSDFINQDGKQVTTETIQNKIVVANFFFTRCPSICPPMRTEFIDVAKEFLEEESFLLVSHSIDQKNDTIEALKKYSDATEIPSYKWLFVTSTEEDTRQQAKQFMTNFRPNEDGTDFYHSSYVALLDKNQRIRGFYNILIPEDVERLKANIKMLLK